MSEATEPRTDEDLDRRDDRLLQLVASIVILLVFAAGLYTATDFAAVARWFPTAVTLTGLVLTGAKIVVDVRNLRRPYAPSDVAEDEQDLDEAGGRRNVLVWIAAVAVLLVLCRLVGFLWGATIWIPLVLLVVSKAKWYSVVIAMLGTYSLVWCAEVYLAMRWPAGIWDLSGVGF
jgi:Flp pilus assembly protein TadB